MSLPIGQGQSSNGARPSAIMPNDRKWAVQEDNSGGLHTLTLELEQLACLRHTHKMLMK